MPNIEVKIENLAQIRIAFGKAPSLMRTGLAAAINKATLTIGRQAAINAPVRTGRLRSSILGGGFTGGFYSAGVGLQLATPELLTGSVGPTANYGVFVEQGTRFMRGQRYLGRAVDSQERIVQGFFTEAVDHVLNIVGDGTKL